MCIWQGLTTNVKVYCGNSCVWAPGHQAVDGVVWLVAAGQLHHVRAGYDHDLHGHHLLNAGKKAFGAMELDGGLVDAALLGHLPNRSSNNTLTRCNMLLASGSARQVPRRLHRQKLLKAQERSGKGVPDS